MFSLSARNRTEDLPRVISAEISAKLKPARANLRSCSSSTGVQVLPLIFYLSDRIEDRSDAGTVGRGEEQERKRRPRAGIETD